jgi:hypothetical protein
MSNFTIIFKAKVNGISCFRFEDSYFQGEKVKCSDFHDWFARGVSQWLDITLLKALNSIKQAVEKDEQEPLDGVKFSSSAPDVLEIFKMVNFSCNIYPALYL